MKKVLALALALASLLALLASCSGGASDLAGAYQLDTTTIEAEMKKEIESMPAEQRPAMEAALPGMMEALAKSEFTLNADNTWQSKFSMMGNDTVEKGTWKVEGDKITFTSTELNGNPHTDETVGTVAGGVISMTEDMGGNPMTLVLRKK